MLDIHQLSCFVGVYEARSISKAADASFLSQQAVSHSLRELERKLGGSLFDRTPGGVVPTKLGCALYDDAKRLLVDCDALEQRAKMMTRGHLGLSLVFANGVFSVTDSPALNQLADFTQTELGLALNPMEQTTGECLDMLSGGEADIICIFNPKKEAGLHIQPLREYPLYVGMAPGHPLAGKAQLSAADMIPFLLINDRRDTVLNATMEHLAIPESAGLQRYAPSTQLSSFADFMQRDNSLLLFTQPFVRTYAGKDAVIVPFQSDARLCLCAVYRANPPERAKLGKMVQQLEQMYAETVI